MQPTIRIDEEVYRALKEQAEAFVDTPNDVLRRVLGLEPDEPEIVQPIRKASRRRPNRVTKNAGRRNRATKRTRVPAGTLLPETEYEVPLLEAVDELGGSAPTGTVLDRLGGKLNGRLTDLDKEPYGRSGYIRWKNRAQFVRDRLVKKGELSKDSPRGVWEITTAGRDRLSQEG